MKLEEIPIEVARAIDEMNTQDQYVKSLGERYQNGETTIQVYDNVGSKWTEVKLVDFFSLQHEKYLALSGYAGDMKGLMTNLQVALDAALPTIALPKDRVKTPPAETK